MEKTLEGKNKFLNEFSISKFGDTVWGVFFNENPDREKGHKSYPMIAKKYNIDYDFMSGITKSPGYNWVIAAMDEQEIEPYRWRDALYCKECKDVIYSMQVHHMHFCTCKKVAIDGGPYYTKVMGDSKGYQYARIDLLTDKVVFDMVGEGEKNDESRRRKITKSSRNSPKSVRQRKVRSRSSKKRNNRLKGTTKRRDKSS